MGFFNVSRCQVGLSAAPLGVPDASFAQYRSGNPVDVPKECLLRGTCDGAAMAWEHAWRLIGPESFEPQEPTKLRFYNFTHSRAASLQPLVDSEAYWKSPQAFERQFPMAVAAELICKDFDSQGEGDSGSSGNTGNGAAISVEFSQQDEESKWISAVQMRKILILFRVCGVVHLKKLFSPALIDAVASAQEQNLQELKNKDSDIKDSPGVLLTSSTTNGTTTAASSTPQRVVDGQIASPTEKVVLDGATSTSKSKKPSLFAQIEHLGSDAELQNHHRLTETATMAARSKARYEIKMPFRTPFICPALTANRMALNVVRALFMGSKVEIDEFSYVTSEKVVR